MTDVVVFGGTGTLGTALRDTLSRVYAPTSKELDVRNDLEVEGYLRRTRPTVVINAVAMLGLDACERDPQSAIRLNAMFPCQLAKLGRALDFRLIHFSTDAVFPGADSSAYTEADAARPLNVYGATKYAGDCLIAAHGRGFDIVRVPTLFGASSRSSGFLARMLAAAARGETLRVSSDVYTNPTYSRDVARYVAQTLGSPATDRITHVANAGRASLHELVAAAVELRGLVAKVHRASHRDFPSIACKATDTCLVSQYVSPLRPWREALREYCGEPSEAVTPKGGG